MDLADDVAVARLAIAVLDLTDLAEPTDAEAADRLCARARAAGVAAVCVWPEYVALLRRPPRRQPACAWPPW